MLHDDEGDAVGEAPGFVGAGLVELQFGFKQFVALVDHDDIGSRLAIPDIVGGQIAIGCGQSIPDFNQNSLRHKNSVGILKTVKERYSDRVIFIAADEKRLDECSIQKYPFGAHSGVPLVRLGVPYR